MHIFHGPTALAWRNQTSSRSGPTPTREREDTIFRSRETYPTCFVRILRRRLWLRLWLWLIWLLRLIVHDGLRDGDIADVGSGKTPTDLVDVESVVWLLCRVGVPCRSCSEVERLLCDVLIGHQGMGSRPGPAAQRKCVDIYSLRARKFESGRLWNCGAGGFPSQGKITHVIYFSTISPLFSRVISTAMRQFRIDL